MKIKYQLASKKSKEAEANGTAPLSVTTQYDHDSVDESRQKSQSGVLLCFDKESFIDDRCHTVCPYPVILCWICVVQLVWWQYHTFQAHRTPACPMQGQLELWIKLSGLH